MFGAPGLRERFVLWKLGSALLLALLILVAPIFRTAAEGAMPLASLLIGIFLVVAVATSLGVISGNPKTFIVIFLSFWYVVVNDKGASAMLDFAGFYRSASPATMMLYLAIGAASVIAALIAHSQKLRRS